MSRTSFLFLPVPASRIPVTQVIRIQDDTLSSVTVDYVKCGYEAVKYLYAKGSRHPGLITGSLKLSPYKFRYQGYKEALEELGLKEITSEAKGFTNSLEYGYQATRQMLQEHPELDAILAAMDAQGIGAMRALKEAGKKVPRNVRIISLTGHEIGSMLETTMTTLEMPAREIGRKAAQLVLEQIEAKDRSAVAIQHVVYDSVLIELEST